MLDAINRLFQKIYLFAMRFVGGSINIVLGPACKFLLLLLSVKSEQL
jgi:hypothetical protein